MEQYGRLQKLILDHNPKEFTRKLSASPIQAKPQFLAELLIDLVMIPS